MAFSGLESLITHDEQQDLVLGPVLACTACTHDSTVFSLASSESSGPVSGYYTVETVIMLLT